MQVAVLMPSSQPRFNSFPEKQDITFTASTFGNAVGLRFLYTPSGDYLSQVTITSSDTQLLNSSSVGKYWMSLLSYRFV
jgi:hypothetical protein